MYLHAHIHRNSHLHHRRKFRSQTSDNMDRWKAEMGRVSEEKRREEKKKEDQKEKRREEEIRSKRESLRRKKIQVHEKVGKSRRTVFFQWFVAPEGRKVGSLKRRVRSQLARWEMKNCTPLWRSTFQSQKCQKLTGSEHFWKLRCRKSARRCGAKQNDGRRGTYAEDMARCISRGRRSTRYMLIRAVRRSGRWFPERASDLQVWEDDFAWQVQHFVWHGITLSWQAQYFGQVEWKNRKTHWYEAVNSALNFPFLKEVSQSCFVFDVVNFVNCGSLAELSRFWCCQVQKVRTSRRITAFSSLQIDRQRGRQIDRQTGR